MAPASTTGAGWVTTGAARSLFCATGSNYKYTRINITLTQSWYGYTNGPYPPYGHGAHHTTAHIRVAVNDPTTNLDRF